MVNSGRIRQHTAQGINRRLQREAEARVAYYAAHPEEIEQRLRELDEEWDIERVVELEAAGTVLTGFLLGMTLNRKWFLLPVLASSMLLLHTLRGGFPFLPVYRRLGLRITQEIDQERYALKAIRGDFEQVRSGEGLAQTHAAFEAARPGGVWAEGHSPHLSEAAAI